MAGRPRRSVLDLCLAESQEEQVEPDRPQRPLEPAEAAEKLACELLACVRNREAGSELNSDAYTALFATMVRATLDAEIAKTDAACSTLEQTLSRLQAATHRLAAIRALARRTPEDPAAVLAAAREIKLTDMRIKPTD